MSSELREEIFKGLKVVGEDSEGEYGYFPDRRPVHELLRYGFVPLDKPAGQLSHQVVAWVRRLASVDSAGHSGTLDPMATGLLPVAINEATKALSTLLLGPKEYYAVMRLHSPVPDSELLQVLDEFTTEIYQRPPQRSSVRRVTRTRTVYEMELVERRGNLALIRVLCQAGTYVRKLIYDMGEVLGVGATMTELRRTKVCNIKESDGLVRLQELALAFKHYREKGDEALLRKTIWPVERAVQHLKKVVVKDSAVDPLCHGAMLAAPGLARISMDIEKQDVVAIYTQKAELVGFGISLVNSAAMEEAEKGFVVRVDRVVMPTGSYPHYRKGAEIKEELQAGSI
ncbi:MAG: RNA-guided pseudouridylation complex pseudouridine synthase subunit Cbf5 [Conexivisphaerales archaeon]